MARPSDEQHPPTRRDGDGPQRLGESVQRLSSVARSVPRGFGAALSAMTRPSRSGVPGLWPSPIAVGSIVFEHVVMSALGLGDRLVPDLEFEGRLDAFDDAAQTLTAAGLADNPLRLFEPPPPPRDVQRARRSWNGLNFGHTWFPSTYEPPADLPGSAEYMDDEGNRIVHMYVLRHDDKPRPYVVYLHPHQSGEARDVFLFGSALLFAGLGVNVVHPVLPLHGHRRSKSSLPYPSPDALTNLFATTQAVHDVRSIFHLLEQRNATAIGVQGYSLGGYVASLMAGVTEQLGCVVAGASPINLSDVTLHHAQNVIDSDDPAGERLRSMFARYRDGGAAVLSSVISPLTFAPLVSRDDRYVLAALGDSMVSPSDALKLWRHWDECELKWLQHSHMTGLMSPSAHLFVQHAVERSLLQR